jgi:hypothetical protein
MYTFLLWFCEFPPDGQRTRPKHVVEYKRSMTVVLCLFCEG